MFEISAYDQGFIAARSEKSESDNPFKEGTECFEEWEDGFYEAKINFRMELESR